MPSEDRRLLDDARAGLASARARTLDAQVRAAASEGGARAKLLQAVRDARGKEGDARKALDAARAAWLGAQPSRDFTRLEAGIPVLLFPARLETRFGVTTEGKNVLRVRIYPDEIVADTHEPALTRDEADAGNAFWDDKARGLDEQALWRRLTARYPAARASWIVAQTTGGSNPPRTGLRPESWTRGAEAALLPDRWTVVAVRGRRTIGKETAIVPEPLILTVGPNPADAIDVSGDGLFVAEETAWTLDFGRAVAAGMAVELPLEAEDLGADGKPKGFDRVMAFGVKSTLTRDSAATGVQALMAAHRHTRGSAFVAQGTPTNNTTLGPSGYSTKDPDPSRTFAVEQAAPPSIKDADGGRFARALGLPDSAVERMPGADGAEQLRAARMNDALWPATLGYFLENMMSRPPAPFLDQTRLREIRNYFVSHVRGRGTLPAFRVGGTPYGILPVTSLEDWQPRSGSSAFETELPRLLKKLLPLWTGRVDGVPRADAGPDAEAALASTLAVDAGAREFRVRLARGEDFWRNLLSYFGLAEDAWVRFTEERRRELAARLGHPGLAPRAAGLTFSERASLFDGAVASADIDHAARVRAASISELKNGAPAGGPKPPLLYHLLRQAALLEYQRIAHDLLQTPDADRLERELIGVVSGTASRPTIWQRLGARYGFTRGLTLGEFLTTAPVPAQVSSYHDSLRALEGLPSDELERLTAETLDACSHRLDAWIGALADRRLFKEVRQRSPEGVHIGGYAWALDVRPRDPSAASGGYIHAPSLGHAAAAAVLRNAHLARAAAERGRIALDLGSRRTRRALALLETVRDGQTLGEALGRVLERRLREAGLDEFIEPLREGWPPPEVSGPTTDAGRPRAVPDALRVIEDWGTGDADNALYRALASRGAASPERLKPFLDSIRADIDALTDLLKAESAYQLVLGNSAGAAAAMDALARGARLPAPVFPRQPRSGTAVHHRVGLVLGDVPPATAEGWTSTPRAAAEPALNSWVGGLLGSPEAVFCRVSLPDGTQAAAVKLRDLGIGPLDALSAAQAAAPGAGGELDKRVLARAFAGSRPPDGAILSFDPKILELLRCAAGVLKSARPLEPAHLLPPESAGASAEAVPLAADDAARVQAAQDGLETAASDLTSAISAGTVSALETALRAAALFGSKSAYPAPGSSVAGLQAAAAAAASDLSARLDEARRAADLAAKTKAVFGADFLFLPRFVPARAEELSLALMQGPELVSGEPRAVDEWIERVGRARPGLAAWRRHRLYARATGTLLPPPTLAQLPYAASARWVGRRFRSEKDRPPSGRLSLLLHRYAAPDAGSAWNGLLLDEWSEVIPHAKETTGVAFNYDDAGAEAPQTLLLAVPPVLEGGWTAGRLRAIIEETLQLAQIRAVDPESLHGLGQIAPALYFTANAGGDAVDSALDDQLRDEPRIRS